MLRHSFVLPNKEIHSAKLFSTARGVYEAYINGSRVGEYVFTPGLSQYNKHHYYQTYDVSDLLEPGENVLAAMLSEGWWSGNITFGGTNWNYFGDQQALLAKLVITYKDGTTQNIVSSPDTWKVSHDGPVRYGSFFQGELYDARRETSIAAWSTSKYDDTQWQQAHEVTLDSTAFIHEGVDNPTNQLIRSYDDMKLLSHIGEPPKVITELSAKSVTKVSPGVFIYDMGQNMVGVPQVSLTSIDAKTSEPIVLRYSEVLYPELPEYQDKKNTLMIENIRAALSHDIYIPREGDQVIQPRFTFNGYRYLEISGLNEALPLDAVKGLVISSVNELSAHYETSNPLVNKLWENITWSLRSNFLSIPTDTPARNERMGWSGDINVFVTTANFMAHNNNFIKRHMLSMRDLQSKAGRFPDVAPVGGGFGGTMWGSAGVNVAWESYKHFGDSRLLEEHYTAMAAYVNYLNSKNDAKTGLLLEGYLSDWLSPEDSRNDPSLLWEAYRIHITKQVADAAKRLNKHEDAARFKAQYTERKAFFNQTYVDSQTGKTIASGVVSQLGQPIRIDLSKKGQIVDTQASYAVPLAFGIFDEKNTIRARNHLIDSVTRENVDDQGQVRSGYSLMTGFIGTASLLPALSNANADALAYKVLQNTSYPSLLYPVVNGATTIWERLNSFTKDKGFDGNNSMNSFNHYAFGAVGSWMMSNSLGIQQQENSVAFKNIVLAPSPDQSGGMTWAKGHYDSMYGRIESAWEIRSGEVHFTFTVPENVGATLHLPTPNLDSVSKLKGNSVGIGTRNGKVTYTLSAGKHEFAIANQ